MVREVQVNHQIGPIKKKDVKKPVSFSKVLQPIYYLSRVFGLIPYSIIHDSNGAIKEPNVTKFDVLWLLISVGFYSLISVLTYNNMVSVQDPAAPHYILILGDYLVSSIIVVFGLVIIGMNMCNRFKLVDILKSITTFDKEAITFISINSFNYDLKLIVF